MATYDDLRRTSLPSLADMMAALKAKRARGDEKNPGDKPADAAGGPQTVSIPGESAIQAQPVARPQQVGVTVGMPQVQAMPDRTYQMQPMHFQAQGQPQQLNPQAAMDPRAAQVRALMAQGLTLQQAMQRVQAGG